MTEVSLQEAQAQFESLFNRALAGEVVYIVSRSGRIRLTPHPNASESPKILLACDIDELPDDFLVSGIEDDWK